MSATIIVSDKVKDIGGFIYEKGQGQYLKCQESEDTTSRIDFTVTNPSGKVIGSFHYPLIHDLEGRDAILSACFSGCELYKFTSYTSTVLVGYVMLKPMVMRENAQMCLYVENLDQINFSVYFYVGTEAQATATIGDTTFALKKKKAVAKASRGSGNLLVLAMLKGSKLVLKAGDICDTYVLTGFVEALNYIKNNWALEE